MSKPSPRPSTKPLRCGWPMKVPNSSTVNYCTLPPCHDGPYCMVVGSDGTVRSQFPRFGATPLTDGDEAG